MKRRYLLLIVLLLPVLGILLTGNQFIYPAGSEYSDLTISHWPNAVFIHRSLFDNGQIPLWSNAILGGYPLAANPLSGLHYPPGWAAILWPEPVTFNLLACLHLIWMGLGMVAFLRVNGVTFGPAIVGAVMLESLPKLQAHYFSGHVSLVYGMSWLPWLLMLEKNRMDSQSSSIVPPGFVWGMIALADIRVAAYAGLLWLAYSAFCTRERLRRSAGVIRAIGRWVLGFAFQTGMGVLIATPLLLALSQYVGLTARADMVTADRLALAVQPLEWLGIFIPFYGKNVEHVVYVGALAVVLAVVAGFLPAAWRKTLFWLGIAVLCTLLSMGNVIPGLGIVMSLPGLDLLRVTGRFLLVGGFALAVAVAYIVQAITELGMPKNARMAALVVSLVGLGFNVAVGAYSSFRPEIVHGTVFWTLVAGLAVLISWQPLNRQWFVPVVVFFVVADLGWVNWNSNRVVTKEAALAVSPALEEIVQDADRPFRVYSPSYSVQQQVAAWYNLELADGVDPLQLRGTIDWMTQASGVSQHGYSVTLPPFSSGNPAVDNQSYIPDAQKLGWMTVRYVVSAFPIDAPGLKLEASDGEVWTYRNRAERPRAWVQDTPGVQESGVRPAVISSSTANKVIVQAEGPGWLVLADVNYPGWSAMVDGQAEEMVTTYGLLRSVWIGSGQHSIEFQFSMPALFIGLAVSLTTCLGWLVSRVWKPWKHRSGEA